MPIVGARGACRYGLYGIREFSSHHQKDPSSFSSLPRSVQDIPRCRERLNGFLGLRCFASTGVRPVTMVPVSGGEYTQSLVADKCMWIPYRSTSLSRYRMWCDEFVRIRRLRCPKRSLVPPIRIERTTNGLGNRCSIQLSYGGMGATILQESRKV